MKTKYEYQSLITLTPNDKSALKSHVERAIKYGSSTMKIQLNNEYEAIKVLDPDEFLAAPMVKVSKEEAEAIWPKEDWSFVAEGKRLLDERGD